jgi:hypothetical protein
MGSDAMAPAPMHDNMSAMSGTMTASCHTHHTTGQSCSCKSAPSHMGTAQMQGAHMMCMTGSH